MHVKICSIKSKINKGAFVDQLSLKLRFIFFDN
jgi:hypothetical protein